MKSNFNKVKNVNKLIFVDNLEVSFSGSLPLLSTSTIPYTNGKKKVYNYNSQCFIEYQPSGTKLFANIADLWIDERKIGEFRFSPRSGYIDSEIINFKFDNVQLYQLDFFEYIDSIVNTLELKFLYISHIEIAVDCIKHWILKFVDKYLYDTNNNNPNKRGSIKHKGKVLRRNIKTNNGTEIHWGNINSIKCIKIYNKTVEIEQNKNPKSYIPVCWKQNGMITDNNTVERFELTLKQKHASKLDYHQLNDSHYLASILETHCENYFEFEQTITNHHKKSKRNVTPINFNDFDTVLLPKFKYVPQNTLYNEKRTLKHLYFQYLQAIHIANHLSVVTGISEVPNELKNHQDLLNTVNSMLFKYAPLTDYYNSHTKGWIKEFNGSNELLTGKLSIDEYFKSIELAHDLKLNIVDDVDGEATDLEKSDGYKKNKRQIHELERAIKNGKLKRMATGSKIVEKFSKPITNYMDVVFKRDYILRHIGEEK